MTARQIYTLAACVYWLIHGAVSCRMGVAVAAGDSAWLLLAPVLLAPGGWLLWAKAVTS